MKKNLLLILFIFFTLYSAPRKSFLDTKYILLTKSNRNCSNCLKVIFKIINMINDLLKQKENKLSEINKKIVDLVKKLEKENIFFKTTISSELGCPIESKKCNCIT